MMYCCPLIPDSKYGDKVLIHTALQAMAKKSFQMLVTGGEECISFHLPRQSSVKADSTEVLLDIIRSRGK